MPSEPFPRFPCWSGLTSRLFVHLPFLPPSHPQLFHLVVAIAHHFLLPVDFHFLILGVLLEDLFERLVSLLIHFRFTCSRFLHSRQELHHVWTFAKAGLSLRLHLHHRYIRYTHQQHYPFLHVFWLNYILRRLPLPTCLHNQTTFTIITGISKTLQSTSTECNNLQDHCTL